MKIYTIHRYYTPKGTLGEMRRQDGGEVCLTIERPHPVFGGDHPCIPEGVYTAEKYLSPTPGKGVVWLLQNVLGRSMIEFHIANMPSQLLGCIAPGRIWLCANNESGVGESELAFNSFMQETQDDVKIQFLFRRAYVE